MLPIVLATALALEPFSLWRPSNQLPLLARTGEFDTVARDTTVRTALAGVQGAAQGSSRAGWEAIQRGDGDKAAAVFREAIAANPRDPDALAGAGLAAHLLGRDDHAIGFLTRALDAAPNYVYAAYSVGQI